MVNQSNEVDKDQAFRRLLHDLAKKQISDKTAILFYQKFEEIYQDGYRHFYSAISRVMYDIVKFERAFYPHSKKELREDTSTLISNIQYLYVNYESYRNNLADERECHAEIGENLRKLYDHITLESIRMSYYDIGESRLAKQGITLKGLTNQVEDLGNKAILMNDKYKEISEKSCDIETKHKEFEDKLSKVQTDYIAILGIFASVVLAFVGGMAFSTSVLENMKDVSIYRLLIVSFVIGLVFVTVIFLMFYFVGILSNRKINGDGSLKPLLLIYALFISLIIIVYGMWNMGAVESRNAQIMRRSEAVDLESAEVSITSDITDDICVEQQNDAAAE